ncbi:hypothetical protein ACFW9D_05895 [Streptomyces sp. NPDC059524]|uniref:hypothetical protein n=1 Tax=Streptomyces sp. NPDC059524 TaxID=3346856 RepID=UPI003681E7E7
MDPAGRYRLTLTIDGRPVANGWWSRLETAESKFTSWVGTYGSDGARIELVDTTTGQTVRSWP